ncbi:YcnI family protein [Sphingomonas sp. CL5.1]|uniref:YcnI family protein n=1 Tax=Sphingomonas sp. CL5.1 TaxID=2653203 RepID=UPI00158436CB|nr:YcnI family protein [Sphingomonas sp. CL5.1]QKR98502.1 YcnI family protein [Sphingomonas sp. CL5.1]
MRIVAMLAAVSALTGAAAEAHIVFAEPEAPAGGYHAGFLRVTHGCGDSPTRSIRVEIPEGVISARPQPKAGWTLAIEHQPLKAAVKGEGGALVTERVSAITWTGDLAADQFDQFGVMMKLPAAAGPLYFRTVQRCAVGSNDWVNIPASPAAWHMTAMPAPMLLLRAATAH